MLVYQRVNRMKIPAFPAGHPAKNHQKRSPPRPCGAGGFALDVPGGQGHERRADPILGARGGMGWGGG